MTAPIATPAAATAGALAGIRVLDLTGGTEQYCGKLFAQLGADVLLIEPPCGSRTRREGPFLDDIPHRERSLPFAYFNQGKRGICLDLDQVEGQKVMRKLVAEADLVITSQPADWMRDRSLDHAALSAQRPAIVTTNISPFGEDGPYASYQGDDLVALAMGGLLYLGGYPEQAPVAAYGNQAVLAAAQFAAVASMIALWDAEGQGASAKGQHVDVSIQESVTMALENSVQFVELENTVRKRNAGQQRQAGTGVFPCADGMVYLMAGGIASNRFWGATTEWMVEAGAPGAEQLREACWNDQKYLQTEEAKRIFASVFLPYAARHTKAELYAEGQRRRIPICPVSTPADLMENRQLAYRQFFRQTAHPYTGATLTVPGAPFALSATPWQLGRPAPRLGEHTCEVLREAGYDGEAQQVLLRQGVIA